MGRMWKENKLSGSDAVAGDMIGQVDDGSNVLGNCLFFEFSAYTLSIALHIFLSVVLALAFYEV